MVIFVFSHTGIPERETVAHQEEENKNPSRGEFQVSSPYTDDTGDSIHVHLWGIYLDMVFAVLLGIFFTLFLDP